MTEARILSKRESSDPGVPETTRGGVFYTPRVDIYETDDEFVVQCDLPGVQPENVELRFERGELTLHGRISPRPQPADYLFEEYGIGDFHRSFTIAAEIDADKISAEYKLGVLGVHLPKIPQAKPKQINVIAT